MAMHLSSLTLRRRLTKKLLSVINLNSLSMCNYSDIASFRHDLKEAKHIVVLTGAGISAESGVPTFRGPGGFWRSYNATDLASPHSFQKHPSLVWEFYNYRRDLVLSKQPNAAHKALADCEKRLSAQGRRLVVVTQNIDELHYLAGSKNVIELHGSLFRVRCLQCNKETENRHNPICEALRDTGNPGKNAAPIDIPPEELPRCDSCGGLLRPSVVWFGEQLDEKILKKTQEEMNSCDLCLVVGTSSVVYPAATFAPLVAARGVPVAEFNVEDTSASSKFTYHFHGPCGQTLPQALSL